MGWLVQIGMLLAAAAVGVAVPLQAGLNGQLGRALGHPMWAVLASITVTFLITLPTIASLRLPPPHLGSAAAQPLWVWFGGFLGIFIVIGGVLIAPRLGAARFVASVVAGQMLASLILDRFALAGYPARPLTVWRLAGALLVVVGVIAMQMAPSSAERPASGNAAIGTSHNSPRTRP